MELRMGSPAPPIKVENWLRGEPLTNFRPGKVYLVEFWATWCGPCVDAMPHLIELQEKYEDSGFEAVGVAACEQGPTADEARTNVDAWLTEKFPNLNYRIGFDYIGEMNKLWMDPSSSIGIPTSFVVDRDGHIAFIGHPAELDDVLPKVLNGSWRSSYEAKAADAKRIAHNQLAAREMSLTRPIYAKLEPAMQAEDWTAALLAIEEGLALMPDSCEFRQIHADLLLHKLRDIKTGMPVMRELVEDAIDKTSEAVSWMALALNQLFDPTMDNSHLPRAERFAMGNELSEQILALNPPNGDGPFKYRRYLPVSQYYYESGNKDRAIELIEVALKSVDRLGPIPDHTKQYYLTPLLQALANYTGEPACHEDLCVAPQNKAPETQNAVTS
ncbi:MAG: TlpA family protein disulfide reductase [Mesorhizobium sp.]|uniref:TlpA disulfide reductase family protein n=1 Tax=Mesorhizobium sp. TaxID=1871066 RepID=UPI000FE729F9|nr:TlpA disulfide reductase family protein [Mesorhizobium sp.]RWC20925.1 MAG: TlpA family protein disulfide reductase [Mesorhizobium sp.]RWC28514.1 MAG: TlpA family protein disulfide reductase [Mesorhizobium sp.]RWC58292.1 MAG: TlpA family protein disulfide reductase [Mesorhizobium sp.]TIL57276.1 MAG: TlpA family protein disulfide reductase [Mesorhizobium sp.]TIW47628.1 MAG: TlpA family protein disulfide reductase [Mesorhizobium sp.]